MIIDLIHSLCHFRERREKMKKATMTTLLLLLLSTVTYSYAKEAFDVRQHLCTLARHDVKNIPDYALLSSTIPDQCTPIHLNLVARHGTRDPVKRQIKLLNDLATRIEVILQDAKEQKLAMKKVPAWFWEWKSPWVMGGELTSEGEEEEYNFGIRIRDKFPQLFNDDYDPDVYSIKATQVPRASASAVAFGMGMFSGKGNLGPNRLRAFAVTSESGSCDIVLRFHHCCENYKTFIQNQEPAVQKLKEPILDEITNTLRRQYELHFTRHDISLLWHLCKQEASLLNITNQACAMFTPSEVSLLEWTDDLELFILKGYGNALNYLMAVPLLEDVVQSMEQAIKAKEEGLPPGTFEKARMRFALLPFSCLLGLFLEISDIEKIRKGKSLELPPKPPLRRNWRGSVMTPYAGNNMLVLYSCPDNSSSKYFVQVLHNEHPVPVPGCNNSDSCPYEVFKKIIVAPNLKYNYDTLCNSKSEQP